MNISFSSDDHFVSRYSSTFDPFTQKLDWLIWDYYLISSFVWNILT